MLFLASVRSRPVSWLIQALGAGACCVLAVSATAAPRDLRAERQASLDARLTSDSIADIIRDRAGCASGSKVASVAQVRSLGGVDLPDAADICVTAMIRLARERKLTPLRDTRTSATTPALALDAGFAAGFARAGAVPASLPSMATLRPIAERCLAQREPNVGLCNATGYAFGVRAANGEVVRVE